MTCFNDRIYFFAFVSVLNILYWLVGHHWKWMHGRFLSFLFALNLSMLIATLVQSTSTLWSDDFVEQIIQTVIVTYLMLIFVSVPIYTLLRLTALIGLFVLFAPIRNAIIEMVKNFAENSLGVEITQGMAIAILVTLLILVVAFLMVLHKHRLHDLVIISILSLFGSIKLTLSYHILYITYDEFPTPRFCCEGIAIDETADLDGTCPLHFTVYLWVAFGATYVILFRIMWMAGTQWVVKSKQKPDKPAATKEEETPLTNNE